MFSMVECYTEMGHIIGQDVSVSKQFPFFSINFVRELSAGLFIWEFVNIVVVVVVAVVAVVAVVVKLNHDTVHMYEMHRR